jgi:hypothetical protein
MKNIRYYLSFIIILSISVGYSQNKKKEERSQWKFTTGIGSVTIEAENLFKINASIYEGLIGREFFIGKGMSLITGVEIIRARGNFNDGLGKQQFLTNEYITVPFSFQFSGNKENGMFLFFSAGVYGSYLYKYKQEDVLNTSVVTKKGLGFNGGIQSKLGIQFEINKKSNFSVSFKSKTDLLNKYKKYSQEFKMKNYYALQLGFGFSF